MQYWSWYAHSLRDEIWPQTGTLHYSSQPVTPAFVVCFWMLIFIIARPAASSCSFSTRTTVNQSLSSSGKSFTNSFSTRCAYFTMEAKFRDVSSHAWLRPSRCNCLKLSCHCFCRRMHSMLIAVVAAWQNQDWWVVHLQRMGTCLFYQCPQAVERWTSVGKVFYSDPPKKDVFREEPGWDWGIYGNGFTHPNLSRLARSLDRSHKYATVSGCNHLTEPCKEVL